MKTLGWESKIAMPFSKRIISAMWLMMLCAHLYFFGIVSNLEAEKYIGEANYFIKNGALSSPRFWLYSITIFIVAVSFKLKLGLIGVVCIQSLFNLWALLYFHQSLHLIFKQSIVPTIIVCCAILYSPYSSWNVFLFTESVFFSMILVLTSAIINHNFLRTNGRLLIVVVALFFTILSRPLGMLFIPAVLFYFYLALPKKMKLVMLPLSTVCIGIAIYITTIIFTTTSDATITLSAQQGCVICGIIPEKKAQLILAENAAPIQQLYFYLTHNFEHFLKLASARLFAFFSMIRTYYSWKHNTFLLLVSMPLYILSALGCAVFKTSHYKPIFYFMVISILTFALVVSLQCDDYLNRFVLGLFPFFLILSAKAILHFKKNGRVA